jgi:hypothetical protein
MTTPEILQFLAKSYSVYIRTYNSVYHRFVYHLCTSFWNFSAF